MEWGLPAAWGAAIVWAVALCYFDVRFRRLPDVLTLPACAVSVLPLVCCADARIGAAVWAGGYLLIFLLGGIGPGDVKLAVPLGAGVGAVAGPVAVLGAILVAQLVTVGWGVVTRSPTVPHGPPMLLAAGLALLV
jgi:leader peptidase (prepilin peptidase)/N-methyltransferase